MQADSVFKSSNFGSSKAKNIQLNAQILHKSKSALGQVAVSEGPGYDSELVNSFNTSRTNKHRVQVLMSMLKDKQSWERAESEQPRWDQLDVYVRGSELVSQDEQTLESVMKQ